MTGWAMPVSFSKTVYLTGSNVRVFLTIPNQSEIDRAGPCPFFTEFTV
jgi:hypothetical protein